MPLVINSIGTSGRDFSTIQAWASAIPADLVADDNSVQGECYNDSEFTGAVNLSGNTTDATHTIALITATGQSFRDNASVRSNVLNYDQSKGVGVRATSSPVIDIGDSNVTINNLQVYNTTSSGYGYAIRVGTSASNVKINDCIFKVVSSGSADANNIIDGGTTVNNCLFIGGGGGISFLKSDSGNVAYNFCTIVVPSNLSTMTQCIEVNLNTGVTAKNCAIFGCTFFSTNITFTTCMTDLASPPTGCTTVTYANQFVDTTSTSGDWREKAGANLQGAGTSDSTNGAFDISGLARPQSGNWDIGAWEIASTTTELLMGQAVI